MTTSYQACAILISCLDVVLILILQGVNCTSQIQLQSDVELVLNQPVQYHCTINGSTILTWRVLRNDGSELGSIRYVSSVNQAPNSIGGLFTARQSLTSIAASISFTVESDIDGYTIICEDGLTMENDNFTITLSSLGQQVIIPTTTSAVQQFGPYATVTTNIPSPSNMTSSLNSYTPSSAGTKYNLKQNFLLCLCLIVLLSYHSFSFTAALYTSTTFHSSIATITPNSPGLSSSLVVAGISVAITVPVTAIITAIITIIIMYLLCIKHNKQNEEVLPNNDYETPAELDNMTCAGNSAYGQYSGRASYRVQCY